MAWKKLPLGLRREQVDFVAEYEVREERPAVEDVVVGAHVEAIEADDVLGQQIHGALDAAEVVDPHAFFRFVALRPLDGTGQSSREAGLADAVAVSQHHMPPGDLGGQNVLELGRVDGDHSTDVAHNPRDAFPGALVDGRIDLSGSSAVHSSLEVNPRGPSAFAGRQALIRTPVVRLRHAGRAGFTRRAGAARGAPVGRLPDRAPDRDAAAVPHALRSRAASGENSSKAASYSSRPYSGEPGFISGRAPGPVRRSSSSMSCSFNL